MNRTRQASRRTLVAAMVVAGLGMVLTGCGDDGGSAELGSDGRATAVAGLLDRIPAPGEPQPAATIEYAGPSDGGPNLALLTDTEGNVVAYACDGETYGEVFEGTVEDGVTELDIEGADGGHLVLDLSGPRPTGSLRVDGAAHDFELAPADDTDAGARPAGFYRRVEGDTTSAWVVTPDGSVTGVTKTRAAHTGGVNAAIPDDVVGAPPAAPVPETGEEPLVFFNKLRCRRADARYQAANQQFFFGENTEAESDAALDEMRAQLDVIDRIPGCRALIGMDPLPA